MKGKPLILLFVGLCLVPAVIVAGQPSLVIKAGKIWTATGDTIANGVIVVEQGRISVVGTSVLAPEGTKVLDLPDKYVMPGIVDAHCHIGLSLDFFGEIEENVLAVMPEMCILDAYNPLAREVTMALQSGVTTALLAPGYGNPVAGQTAVVKLVDLKNDTSIINRSAGIKISLGNEALSPDRRPTSRAGLIALLKEELDRAKSHDPKSADARTQIMNRIANGQMLVHIYCSTVDEILAAVELIDAYKLKATLVGAREADELANVIAERSIPVVYTPVLLLSRDKDLKRVGALAGAEVKVAFASFAPKTEPSDLRTSAIVAAKYGMAREAALRAVTIHAAQILGVAQRLGSIEPGKDADLVILNGDPLELTSRVEMVIINGNIVYQREQK